MNAIDLSTYQISSAVAFHDIPDIPVGQVEFGSTTQSFMNGIWFKGIPTGSSIFIQFAGTVNFTDASVWSTVGSFHGAQDDVAVNLQDCHSVKIRGPSAVLVPPSGTVVTGRVAVTTVGETTYPQVPSFVAPIRSAIVAILVNKAVLPDAPADWQEVGWKATNADGFYSIGAIPDGAALALVEEGVLKVKGVPRTVAVWLTDKNRDNTNVNPNNFRFGPQRLVTGPGVMNFELKFQDPTQHDNPILVFPVYNRQPAEWRLMRFSSAAKSPLWWQYTADTANVPSSSASSIVQIVSSDPLLSFKTLLATAYAQLTPITRNPASYEIDEGTFFSDTASDDSRAVGAALANYITGRGFLEPYELIGQIYLRFVLADFSGNNGVLTNPLSSKLLDLLNDSNEYSA